MKPTASISMLRQKVWHLLDLPDYCEELIVLKSPSDVEIALTELRKGNDPQRPYILEVWLPGMQSACKKLFSFQFRHGFDLKLLLLPTGMAGTSTTVVTKLSKRMVT